MLRSLLIILICCILGYVAVKKTKNPVSNTVGEVGGIVVGLFIGIAIAFLLNIFYK